MSAPATKPLKCPECHDGWTTVSELDGDGWTTERSVECEEPGCHGGSLDEVTCSACGEVVSLLCGEYLSASGECRACDASERADAADTASDR